MKIFVSIALFFVLTLAAFAQVPVAMAPPLHFQFFDANGVPLANGKLFTYAAGTTTPLNTYADAGGISQNPSPILLDGSGSPSNGTVQTGIFLANLSYKFVAMNSSNVFQWSVDNVSTYFGLLNSANLWTANQTFAGTISDTLTDNQMIFGVLGNQSIFDFPPPSATTTYHASLPQAGTISDNFPTDTSTDSFSNKTLLNPLFNSSGCSIVNGPGTYICVPNASPTGTSTGALTKLTGAPSAAIITATTDVSGIIGITVAGSGTTGNATIQQDGQVPCIFDGATTAGDYVGISSTVAGDCTDAGASAPVGSQNVGIVLSTNASAGTYPVVLNPGGSSGTKLLCQNTTPVTVNASTTAQQTVQTCAVPTSLNAVGKVFRVIANLVVSTSSSTSFTGLNIVGTASPTLSGTITSSTSTTSSYQFTFSITCAITVAGSPASMTCTGPVSENTVSGSPVVTISNGAINGSGGNLTGATMTVSTSCSFGSASVSNSCVGSNLFVEQLN